MKSVGWRDWLVRGFAGVTALAAVLQPIFAGQFLSGSYGALRAHRDTGLTLVGLVLLTTLVAIPLARRTRNWALVRMGGGLAVLTTLQAMLGFTRSLGIHVPLGILVVGGLVSQAMLAFRPAPAAEAAEVETVPVPAEEAAEVETVPVPAEEAAEVETVPVPADDAAVGG